MAMADRRLGSRLRVCELRALWQPRVPVRPGLLRPVTPALPAARTRCGVHLLCGVTVFPAPWTLTQPTGLPQLRQRPANPSFTIANRAKKLSTQARSTHNEPPIHLIPCSEAPRLIIKDKLASFSTISAHPQPGRSSLMPLAP